MAVRHYVEFINETISGLVGPDRRSDGGWIVEWASLKAYPRVPSASDGKSSAGIWTHAEQPSRKREYVSYRFPSPDAVDVLQSPIPREGVAAIPYRDFFTKV
jgi:hypothetical protein